LNSIENSDEVDSDDDDNYDKTNEDKNDNRDERSSKVIKLNLDKKFLPVPNGSWTPLVESGGAPKRIIVRLM
jgi:hypothetical protein